MEQGRFSLTPRTQRRSQNIHSDAAKIDNFLITSKFWSSKFKEKCIFPLMRRDKIRQMSNFRAANA